MATTMRRLTLVEPRKFILESAPVPEPGPEEALVRVARVGVCGSDLTIYRGHHPYAISPLVMGHEFSGVIVGAGAGAAGRKPGERVAVVPHLVCGACDPCRREVTNFCERLRCMGAEAHGAHADYIAVPSAMALPIPDSMTLEMAALIEPACVGYHGARREPIAAGGTALVIGAGPIGLFTLQAVKALGAGRAIIADLDEARLALAERLGAGGAIPLRRESLEQGLLRIGLPIRDVDLFYDCVGLQGQVLDSILAHARRGAGVVVIGVLQRGTSVPRLPDFVQHELRLSGSTMYTPQDFRDMIGLMSSRRVRIDGAITHTVKLEDVPGLLAEMDRGAFRGFKVMIDVGSDLA
jgi:L-iditol 2-dehydrogenase